jgi:hypothetical protein
MKTPDYINPNPKKVSEVDLKKALKEINDKNKRDRWQAQIDLNKALNDGFRCGPSKPYNS